MNRVAMSDEQCSVCAHYLAAFDNATSTKGGGLVCEGCANAPDNARARIAALFGVSNPRQNPLCPVDYADPEVIAASGVTGAEIARMHNTGEGADRLALLFEIGDEEGWT